MGDSMNELTYKRYIEGLSNERKEVIEKIIQTISINIPEGFVQKMEYGMIGYVVPFERYPKGYRADKTKELPLMHIASMKSHVAIYHYGLYSNKELLDWFYKEYGQLYSSKIDIGKSCIRFKNMREIPYDLIGQLSKKLPVEDWINLYESQLYI